MNKLVLDDPKLTTAQSLLSRFRNAELIKYSPEKRGLFLIEIGAEEYFVKLYPKKFQKAGRGLRIHRASIQLWKASTQNLVSFRVPSPVFWDAETRSLWQKRLPGAPLINFLCPALAVWIGHAIAEMARLSIDAPRVFGREQQIADTLEFAVAASRKFPALAAEILRFCDYLATAHRNLPARRLVPAHGDMHIDQWLFDGKRPGLLDFEDLSMAEFERDAAFFCVQIDAEYGATVDADGVERDFLSGIKAAGIEIDERIYRIYKAHKWIAKLAKATDEDAARAIFGTTAALLEVAR